MAKRNEYPPVIYSDLLSSKFNRNAYDLLRACLSLPIIQRVICDRSVQFWCYEKSFWGKKDIVYLKIVIIDDLVIKTEDCQDLPDHRGGQNQNGIYLGFEVISKFKSYYCDMNTVDFSTRKFIANYSIMLDWADEMQNAISNKIFQNFGEVNESLVQMQSKAFKVCEVLRLIQSPTQSKGG